MTMATAFIPDESQTHLPFVLGGLAPTDRRALCAIVETVELLSVEGGPDLLVMPATAELIDTLAAFTSEAEDRENDLEDEEPEDAPPDLCDEETADEEPSLGSLNSVYSDQREWVVGGTMDLEPTRAAQVRVVTLRRRDGRPPHQRRPRHHLDGYGGAVRPRFPAGVA
jgi:hypothetical protein